MLGVSHLQILFTLHSLATVFSQLAVIYNACSANTIRRALFSATFAHDVKMFCKETMDNVVQVNIGARSVCRVTVAECSGATAIVPLRV